MMRMSHFRSLAMNDESRKRLTLYLGECWHERYKNWKKMFSCKKCGESCVEGRSFDSWTDLGALVERIMKRNDYFDFHKYVYPIFEKETYGKGRLIGFEFWLIENPTRFCELVDRWLEGKEKP
jgi:hypothetical protein